MKKAKKHVTRLAKSGLPIWTEAVNWVVLLACLIFGLLLFGSALSGLAEARMDTSSNRDLIYSKLWVVAFLFATMGMSFYACVKIYYKNITGYISFFLVLLFFAIYFGMMSSPVNVPTNVPQDALSLTPFIVSLPGYITYFFIVPAILVFFVFILMLKYLKPFTKQDIILIALYILFFLLLAPSSLSAGIDIANKTLSLK